MLHAAPRKGIRDSGARNKSGQTGCELNVESGRIIVFIFFCPSKGLTRIAPQSFSDSVFCEPFLSGSVGSEPRALCIIGLV